MKKKLLTISLILVVSAFAISVCAERMIGDFRLPCGCKAEIYHTQYNMYKMVIPNHEEEYIITIVRGDNGKAIIAIDGKDTFSSYFPYDTWIWHISTGDEVLPEGSLGDQLCDIIARHFFQIASMKGGDG